MGNPSHPPVAQVGNLCAFPGRMRLGVAHAPAPDVRYGILPALSRCWLRFGILPALASNAGSGARATPRSLP